MGTLERIATRTLVRVVAGIAFANAGIAGCSSTHGVDASSMDAPADARIAMEQEDASVVADANVAAHPDDAAVGACPGALEATSLTGGSPYGELDMELVSIATATGCGSGHHHVWVTLRSAAGEELVVTFRSGDFGEVPGRSELEGSLWLQSSPDAAVDDRQVKLVADVRYWSQADEPSPYPIDVTLSIDEPDFDTAPLVIRGSFCEHATNPC